MKTLFCLTAGAATWTLLEHRLHDFLGHQRTRNAFGHEHLRHHATTSYHAPAWKKVLAVGFTVVAAWLPASLVLGARAGAAYAIGLAAAYGGYELTHRRLHTRAPLGPLGRYLRRHHFYHHFHDPKKNFGVTSPAWDWALGTFARPGVITVPARHAMDWLLEPVTGGVAPAFAADYELKAVPVPSK